MLLSSFGRASTSGHFWSDINSYPFTTRLLYCPDQILAFFVKPALSFIIQNCQTSNSCQNASLLKIQTTYPKCFMIKIFDFTFGFSCCFCLSDNSNTIKFDSIQALSKYAINTRLNKSCIDQSSCSSSILNEM